MSRTRCARAPGPPAGEVDPEKLAGRWAELGRRVQDRAVGLGVWPLVHMQIGEAAGQPDTWVEVPTEDRAVALARILGGRRAHYNGPAGSMYLIGNHPIVEIAALWQHDPLMDRLAARESLPGAALAGPPPGMDVTNPMSPVGRALTEHVRNVGSVPTVLGAPGGVATEAVVTATRGTVPVPVLHQSEIRALACLLDGTGEFQVDPDGAIRIRLPGSREMVAVPVEDLRTTDPRLARWFLRLFDWNWWWGLSGFFQEVVVVWLSALAPVDRSAARTLAERCRTLGDPWVGAALAAPALRACGMDDGAPGPVDGVSLRPERVPVLWWRRVITRLLGHPDRLRAVEEAEAAWVRLWPRQ